MIPIITCHNTQSHFIYHCLVLLLVSLITVMFYVDSLISRTHLCSIFLSLYIVLIDVLIYSAAQLQECLINFLLTYLQ